MTPDEEYTHGYKFFFVYFFSAYRTHADYLLYEAHKTGGKIWPIQLPQLQRIVGNIDRAIKTQHFTSPGVDYWRGRRDAVSDLLAACNAVGLVTEEDECFLSEELQKQIVAELLELRGMR